MPGLSSAAHDVSPPVIDIPREYNAAHDLIERNLQAGRGSKLAYIDDNGHYTYSELAERVNRCAAALLALGLQREQRVLLCLQDGIDFPTAFLGCIKAGLIPVATNTLLKTPDYDYMVRDSRATALIVSAPLWPLFEPIVAPRRQPVLISNGESEHCLSFTRCLQQAASKFETAPTCCDEACFWLYSSGSTGLPKGTIHAHSSLIQTAELFARPILGIREEDVVFSAPKLFFAYGLGNALTFPLSVGATAVLMAERPTPEAVFARLRRYRPTIFAGVPTLYASMLACTPPDRSELALRVCVSSGESLPAHIGERWREHFGVGLVDGIGSTEMLHIFLSNRPDDICSGTTGRPVPGYQLRLADDQGQVVPAGEIGELQVAGPTAAMGYWNNRERSRNTFNGPWTRSGDKYYVNEQGCYVHAGRTDDMLKVGGIYVSPTEVESVLISHPAVLEAAVIGHEDVDKLVKPLAFVVLQANRESSALLAEQLKQHVKTRLAPYKYPRWICFSPQLPKTATGKIQRFKLRAQAATEPLCLQ